MSPETLALLWQYEYLCDETFDNVCGYFAAMEDLCKPMTNLEMYDKDPKSVLELKEGLESLGYFSSFNFDVCRIDVSELEEGTDDRVVSCNLNVSPFKTLVEAARVFGFGGVVADLSGILVGYHPQDVWDFCLRSAPCFIKPEQFDTRHIKERGRWKNQE